MAKKAKKSKETKETTVQQCDVAGCGNPAEEGDTMCALHATITDLGQDAFSHAKKAFKKGETGRGILSGLAGLVLGHSDPFIKNMMGSVMGGMQSPPPPRPQAPPTCWAVLGLDPKTATEKDVRRVAAAMARVYHPDQAGSAISQDKMKEINQAVSDCLSQLKKR